MAAVPPRLQWQVLVHSDSMNHRHTSAIFVLIDTQREPSFDECPNQAKFSNISGSNGVNHAQNQIHSFVILGIDGSRTANVRKSTCQLS
ncbi:hypothetical protein ABF87_08400 [Nitrosomonas sp. JL21]|nr:hypothetical protein [Nitrosomonas sp. JL21]